MEEALLHQQATVTGVYVISDLFTCNSFFCQSLLFICNSEKVDILKFLKLDKLIKNCLQGSCRHEQVGSCLQ